MENTEDEAETCLFVGNFPLEDKDINLRTLFMRYGKVIVAKIFTRKGSFKSKGCGIVQFATHEDALNALNALNGINYKGNAIRVKWAGKDLAEKQLSTLEPRKPENRPAQSAKEFSAQHDYVKKITFTEAKSKVAQLYFKDLESLREQLKNGYTSAQLEDLLAGIKIMHIPREEYERENAGRY